MLDHPKGVLYAQFSSPLTAKGYRALDALFAKEPALALRTYGYGDWGDVDFLRALPSARRLCLEHGPIEDWSGLADLPPGVRELELGEYARGAPLEHIAARASLESLTLQSTASRARDYALLEALPKLRAVSLKSAALPGPVATRLLAAWPALRSLQLQGCKLSDLGFLSAAPSLEHLTLRGPRGTAELGPLASLRGLRELRLFEAPVESVEPLAGLTKLERLTLSLLKPLADLGPLRALTQLHELDLYGLPLVTRVPSLAEHTALRRVYFSRMPALESLAPIAAAPALESLGAFDCKHLDAPDFAPFEGHRTLNSLRLGLGSLPKHRRIRERLRLPE